MLSFVRFALRINVIAVSLGVASILTYHRSQAQQPPTTPPQAVVAEAQRAAAISGRSITGAPTSFKSSEAQDTGDTLWELTWGADHEGVTVTVDEQQGRAVNFDDWIIFREKGTADDTGANVTVTQSDTQATLNYLASQLSITLGDWRDNPSLLRSTTPSSGGDDRYWFVERMQYVNNVPAWSRRLYGYVEPYQGRIYHWTLQDNGTLVAPNGPIISEPQARQIVTNAFASYAASILTPSDSTAPTDPPVSLAWRRVYESSTLTRLSYQYYFDLPPIEDPNYDETDPNAEWHGRWHMAFVADVDAETGEVWGIANGLGGGVVTKPNYFFVSPRRNLLSRIIRDRSLNAFALIFAGGRPAKAIAPSKAADRFTVTVTPSKIPSAAGLSELNKKALFREYAPRAVDFAFNPAARRLTWKTEPGKWSGLALSPTQTKNLSEWLQQRKTNGLDARRIQ